MAKNRDPYEAGAVLDTINWLVDLFRYGVGLITAVLTFLMSGCAAIVALITGLIAMAGCCIWLIPVIVIIIILFR